MSRTKIRLGNLNIRSLCVEGKLDDLKYVVEHRKIEILCLEETWHMSSKSRVITEMRKIPHWTVVEKARPITADSLGRLKHGGGVGIVSTQPDISVSKIGFHFHSTEFEHVVGRVECNGHQSFVLVVLYRPGGSKLKPQFFEDLRLLLEKASNLHLEIVLAGDVNICMNFSNSTSTLDFLDVVEMFDLSQHVRSPTHEAGNTIDVLCTSRNRNCLKVQVADVGLSDHFLILWSLPLLDATSSAGPDKGRKRPLSDGH